MSDGLADLKRVLGASGIYAAAGVAQRGLAFLLLPIYTRYIDPAEYGVLELLTTFSAIVFGCLLLGLPSAIIKCYHRDCETPQDRAGILTTALGLALPVVGTGAALLFVFADPVSRVLLGTPSAGGLVRVVVATGVLSSLIGLVLAKLRAGERALAFSIVSFIQFAAALLLNIVLVVKYDLGVPGILWGNLASNVIALPVALAVVRKEVALTFRRPLAQPLLRFGLLLIPVVLSGWIVNMSDRWVLRLYRDLAEVAVYGVGYKFGMIVELAIVWPFQLAWPAVSFSISHRTGHRRTYARALTYLWALLVYLVVALSLTTRIALPVIVGEGYGSAYLVVPLVSLAYAFNGIQYCVSPGVHISNKTRYLTYISMAAAALNLGLNFLLIPRWGMMGAAWATAFSYLLVAVVSGFVSYHFYTVGYEYGRLGKITVLGAALWLAGSQVAPEVTPFAVAWHLGLGFLGLPLGLLLLGFVEEDERAIIRSQLLRLSFLRRQ